MGLKRMLTFRAMADVLGREREVEWRPAGKDRAALVLYDLDEEEARAVFSLVERAPGVTHSAPGPAVAESVPPAAPTNGHGGPSMPSPVDMDALRDFPPPAEPAASPPARAAVVAAELPADLTPFRHAQTLSQVLQQLPKYGDPEQYVAACVELRRREGACPVLERVAGNLAERVLSAVVRGGFAEFASVEEAETRGDDIVARYSVTAPAA